MVGDFNFRPVIACLLECPGTTENHRSIAGPDLHLPPAVHSDGFSPA